MNTLSVLLSGENTPWMNSLAHAFQQNPNFGSVDIVAPPDTMAQAAKQQPDVLLWRPDVHDPALPVCDLIKQCPCLIPIAVVQNPNQLNLLELLKDGLCGCLPMRLRPRQIVSAVDMMVTEGLVCLPRFNAESFSHLLRNNFKHEDSSLDLLTGREREIFYLLADNNSNQEIAELLCLAESTVKSHLHNIFRKLGVRNRSGALIVLHHS